MRRRPTTRLLARRALIDGVVTLATPTEDWSRAPDRLLSGHWLEDPARYTGRGQPRVVVTLPKTRQVWGVALAGVTLKAAAKLQVALFGDVGRARLVDRWPADGSWGECFGRELPSPRLAWSDPDLWGGRVEASEVDAPPYSRHVVVWFSAPREVRALEVTLDNGGGTGFDLGMLFVDYGFESECGLEFGRTLTFNSGAVVEKTLGGGTLVFSRPTQRRQSLTFPGLSDDDRVRLQDLLVWAGAHEPLLLLPAPDDTLCLPREAMICTVDDGWTLAQGESGWTARLSLTEALG